MITTLQINLPQLIHEMSQVPLVLVKSLRTELKHQLVEIQKLAMKKHRHKTRYGQLNNSLQRDMANDGLLGQVYFETGIAQHGVYVHEGHGAPGKSVTKGFPYVWQPDRFLYEALAAREPVIKADMENALMMGLFYAGMRG